MNGVNKLKICKSNGRNEENYDEDEEEDINIAQPSTSRAGLLDEPKWNTSTRQIYEDNLKSTSSSAVRKCDTAWPGPVVRERIPSVTDSTSSDDSCVYMYKGDDGQRNGNDVNKLVDCSSPEMDYLEMDFDPCQSNGHDSSDGSYCCDVGDLKDDENNSSFCGPDQERNSTPTNIDSRIPSPNVDLEANLSSEFSQPSTSKIDLSKIPLVLVEKKPECSKIFPNLNDQGPNKDINIENEFEMAETEEMNSLLCSHRMEGPHNLACCISNINQAMCFMYGLGAPLKDEEKLQELLLRPDVTYPTDMPITEFLNELSNGLVTIPLIQDSIDKIFGGTVTSKFFTPYPPAVNLSSWLQCWSKRGAAVLLCWNFHLTDDNCNCTVNPSWHYQLVFSTSSMGIHITTHDDLIKEKTLKKLLTNPSDVLIHRDAVMAHWNPHSDLVPLLHSSDHSWKQYNVLGQVVNIIREAVTGKSDDEIRYVRVPSTHKSGVLILMRSDNIHLPELLSFEGFPVHENTQK